MNTLTTNLCRALRVSVALTLATAAVSAQAAVPGILGPTFNLTASADLISQPDGAMIYSWGYGCTDATPTGGFAPIPAGQGPAPTCPLMQVPAPTLIVTEGTTFTVNLTNALPVAAGNTSIIFAGLQACAGAFDATTGACVPAGGVGGRLTQEAAAGGTVTYTVKATKPGTYAYYSGSQPDLQIEMGLYGAIVVVPSAAPTTCIKGPYSLASAAYDNAATCYDREYLFQFSEIDPRIHDQAYAQVQACPTGACPQIVVNTEPYRPHYFLVNGRSMPDDMDTPYAVAYAHQPYNGNPHMHPGEKLLMRVVGQGRWQHPFHFHGNHARVLARDSNLILSQVDNVSLAGPLLFTIPTVSGQTVDAVFTWTGKGLNWDVYNHKAAQNIPCTPDAFGYNTDTTHGSFGEWCADHNKEIPVTPPDPQIVANGQWYAGTPYLGIQTSNSGFNSTPLPPGTLNQNDPGAEAGYAYMWHSHNEREITTNDVFPGGMMMMLLIDPYTWVIDETL
jgi:FtsP/CotA-like multicopper oxidase with cupredoxin domain